MPHDHNTPDPAARIRELEAALARQAQPANGTTAVVSVLNTVLGMFPRWLIVAAGVVVVISIAAGSYYGVQIMAADWQLKRIGLLSALPPPPSAENIAARVARLRRVANTGAKDEKACNPELDPLPFGTTGYLERAPGTPLPPCVGLEPGM